MVGRKGKQVWSDKEYLEGEWENNEPHGFGVKMWATGDVYKGQWVAGKRIGYGMSISPSAFFSLKGPMQVNMNGHRAIVTWACGKTCIRMAVECTRGLMAVDTTGSGKVSYGCLPLKPSRAI